MVSDRKTELTAWLPINPSYRLLLVKAPNELFRINAVKEEGTCYSAQSLFGPMTLRSLVPSSASV